MGGRGSAFQTAAHASVKIQSAKDAKAFSDLKDYMATNYNIKMADDLQKCDFQAVKSGTKGIEDILKEFPQSAYVLHELNCERDDLGANSYAAASAYGKIHLNPAKYALYDTIKQGYAHDVSTGYHPAGTSADSIMVHEAGHILERALIDKKYSSVFERAIAWNKRKVSGAIISEACKAAKKSPDGKGLKNTQLIEQVSRYANKNRSETLAECVADYHANGDKAKPLSREVWKILKRELG